MSIRVLDEGATVQDSRAELNFVGGGVTVTRPFQNDRVTVTIPSAADVSGWTDDGTTVRLTTAGDLVFVSDANAVPGRAEALLRIVDANVVAAADVASVRIEKTTSSFTDPPTHGPALYLRTKVRYDFALLGDTDPATAWPWAEQPRQPQNDDYPWGKGFALRGNGTLSLGATQLRNRERLHVAQTSYQELPYELAWFTGYDRAAPAPPIGQPYCVVIDGAANLITNGSLTANGAFSTPGSQFPPWGGAYMVGAWADIAGAALNGNYFSGAGGTLDHFQFVRQGDTAAVLRIRIDGTLSWGDGAAAHDVVLARTAGGGLQHTGAAVGFMGAAPVPRQNAATPTVAEIKAGLVALGLFNP